MKDPIGEADGLQRLSSKAFDLAALGVEKWKLHIFESARPRQEMKGLKHEADALVAEARLLHDAQLGDVLTVEQIASGSRLIEKSEDAYQR
jgi:hypothetical protein